MTDPDDCPEGPTGCDAGCDPEAVADEDHTVPCPLDNDGCGVVMTTFDCNE